MNHYLYSQKYVTNSVHIYMCLSIYIYTIHGGKPYEQTYLMNHKYPM